MSIVIWGGGSGVIRVNNFRFFFQLLRKLERISNNDLLNLPTKSKLSYSDFMLCLNLQNRFLSHFNLFYVNTV